MGKRESNTVATKERIVDAAEALFDKHGISSTSLANIAEQANVSTGTVFIYYPAKADIIRAILSRLFAKSTLKDLPSTPARTPEDAMDQLTAIVQRAVDAGAQNARGVGAAWSAVQVDPAFASLWEREQSRRWNELKVFTTQWAERGLLKPKLSATQAADILWSMTGPLVFRAFVRESGWNPEQYQRWLKTVLYREVLGVGTPPEFR
ncbi:TetR/AcrR family transcriptional regulator [Caulobacter sp. KR2-114]|uniref:TetR/AcrR family transcriptional regulator n=1 Tax=Caulobacter sp. KR2-114 TaxID=3400912 RepID=UPI003C0538D4